VKLRRGLGALAAGTLLAGLLPLLTAGAASAVTGPPWEPDPNSAGGLTFYDAAGNVLTSGANLSHLADYVAANGPKQDPGVTKATLFFAAPDHNIPDTSQWVTNGSQSASTSFPNPAAPNPIKGPGFANPLVTLTATNANMTAWLGGVVHDTTAGYANIYQVRITESGPGGVVVTKFWSADIQVDSAAGTWREVYPVAGSTATPTSTTLAAAPASPIVSGTATTLTATVTPAGGVGSVQFFDGATSLGTVAVSAGAAALPATTFGMGSHSLTAKFIPTDSTAFSPSTSAATPYLVTAQPSTYTTVTPCRVFDTRYGTSGCSTPPTVAKAPIGAGGVLAVKVTDMGGVPADATAVVLNVTAVGATGSTFVSVYPAAPTPPTVSNLNVANGNPVPNLVVVPVGAGGVVDFFNHSSTVNLIADVAGYYSPTGGSLYTTTGPCRLFDTRYGTLPSGACSSTPSVTKAPLVADGVLKFKVTGANGVPDNATAVVVNITAVGATKSTFISAYPDAPTPPTISNLNIASAGAVPNLAIIPVGPGGLIDFYNKSGSINVIGDLAGYFAPTGAKYTTTGPCRIFDTRYGVITGGCSGAPAVLKAPVGANASLKVKVTGVGGVPDNATAVVLNVTAVGATIPGTFVTVYPDPTKPGVSNLNVNGAGAIPNLVVVPIGPGGFVDFYNFKGSVNLLADVAGYFSP
jgi:Bacterial Ig-like domain (group 3)